MHNVPGNGRLRHGHGDGPDELRVRLGLRVERSDKCVRAPLHSLPHVELEWLAALQELQYAVRRGFRAGLG